MNAESDHDLAPAQWEALKALRVPLTAPSTVNRSIVEQLVALDLAAMREGLPAITPRGRKVLIRGSSRLWDVAA